VEDSFVTTGGSVGSMNTARLSVVLMPRGVRKLTAAQVAQQTRTQLARFPGFRAFVTLPPALQVGGKIGNSTYSLAVQSANTDELYAWVGRLDAAIAALPEVQDVSNDMEMKSPRVNLELDRDKAAAVGLNAAEVENALYSGFGPQWASTIYGASAQYRVLLELQPKFQEYADSLREIAFKTASGAMVPLESVVRFHETVGPQTVNHSGQLPAVTISFALRPGVSLGTATAAIKRVADALLPPTMTG